MGFAFFMPSFRAVAMPFTTQFLPLKDRSLVTAPVTKYYTSNPNFPRVLIASLCNLYIILSTLLENNKSLTLMEMTRILRLAHTTCCLGIHNENNSKTAGLYAN
ncbi:hypothetical protein SAMN04488244_10717 [Vibrio hangzhouensis]|uniref:Uncharacterized protein n=1 Tax=Vibrio hangzhouensis TaxID=462991 RepID=A0A1H5XDY4_9VIBR|nr:hypothetical protein SAMN04488244_10717 [Vibrio hangzhouensis]